MPSVTFICDGISHIFFPSLLYVTGEVTDKSFLFTKDGLVGAGAGRCDLAFTSERLYNTSKNRPEDDGDPHFVGTR